MKKTVGLFAGAVVVSILLFGWIEKSSRPVQLPKDRVRQHFTQDLDTLERLIAGRLLPLAEASAPVDSLRLAFIDCRQRFKKLEHFTEYYLPGTSRLINGTPLDEVEVEETKAFEPAGFQVIEELLFAEATITEKPELVRQIRNLRNQLARIRTVWTATELTDAHVFDALRLQVFRIMTLGIAGFDTPLCRTAMPEAASSLISLQSYLAFYPGTDSSDVLKNRLQEAATYLTTHSDFDAFDRAHFILTFANPISRELLAYQKKIGVQPFTDVRTLRADAATLFEPGAFNADFWAPNADMRTNQAKVLLGEKLFSDPILSATNTRSCASCHQPDKAFTDGLPKNTTLAGSGLVLRNTPTIINAALQNSQFYDMRSQTLENQSLDVVHNVTEMHGSLDSAARKLQVSSDYVKRFRQAFPQSDGRISPVQIQNALSAYERSLVRLDARFDRYMRGEKAAMSLEEINGFNLFMGKAKCGICHFMPLFNGTIPPGFTRTESEVIGVPIHPKSRQIDPDLGRYALTKLPSLKYAFKTPTVRNTTATMPYMHNGAFQNLDEVIDFYDGGGGHGLGIELENQTLPTNRLDLSKSEKSALLAFLKTLTDLPTSLKHEGL
ncbi:cytochrome-c peroxidase [Larkinella sp. GY13]|uniref:cytochrome-c peroxidase n=1 Tax=Larkinella sp. GY13 TaxID=3453720 RepID=UPI003EE834C3